MGLKQAGFPKFGFNPIGLKKSISNILNAPFLSDLVQWIKNGVDQIGKESREEVGAWYLEGDGTRYTDTGIVPTQTTTLRVWGNFNTTGVNGYMGMLSPQADFYFGSRADNQWGFNFGDGSEVAGGVADTSKHKFEISGGKFFIDDVEIFDKSGETFTPSVLTLFLLSLNNGGTSVLACNFNLDKAEIEQNGLTYTANFETGNQDAKVLFQNKEINDFFYGTIQNATGTDRVQTFDYRLDRDMDFNGFTEADGATYYEDEALTIPIPTGKRSPNVNGKTVWYTADSTPSLAPSTNKGELKGDVTTVIGTSTEQDTTKNTVVEATLALTTQHYDIADIDNPIPISRAITSEYLNDSNRYFTSEYLNIQLLYNRELTTEEVEKVESYLGI